MNTDLFKKIIQPNNLQNKVAILEEKLPAILDDFKKYYVFFNKNPTYNEYQIIYENIQSNLNSINRELESISNQTNENSGKISEYLIKLNKSIKEEKKKNLKFKNIQGSINNNYDNSKIMINEYKQTYNDHYMKNVLIVLGIFISGAALIKVFTNRTI
jgi:CCR4-NOT transcriptional regulation complex NOT5 subunit